MLWERKQNETDVREKNPLKIMEKKKEDREKEDQEEDQSKNQLQ